MITKNPGSQSLVVHPAGDLDSLTADHYRQRLRPMLEEGTRFIIFDFEKIDFISSSGLGLLVELYKHVSSKEGALRLINCNDRINTLLKHTRLDQILLDHESTGPEIVPLESINALMGRELVFCSKINETVEKTLRSNDRQEIGKFILEGIVSGSQAKRGALYLWNEDELRLAASEGFGAIKTPPASINPRENSVECRAIEENKILEFDCADSVGASPLAKQLAFSKAVFLPVAGSDSTLGLVVLEAKDCDEDILQCYGPLIRTYCSICGLALEKNGLVGQLQVQNEDLSNTLLELQQFQSTLVDASRLAALGTVISGIGHLMNNKLVPIIGYSDMLAQLEDLPDKTQSKLTNINEAATELKDVMDKLIKVSKARDIEVEVVDLNEIITKTLTMLGNRMEESGVSLRLNMGIESLQVQGDYDLLIQAFLVILHRACASFDEANEDRWIEIATSFDEEMIEVRVEDNGRGLADSTIEEMVDPLVPIVELEEGQLFNFSIPRSVVRRHRGEFSIVENAEGGTVVSVRLPLADVRPPLAAIQQRPMEEDAAQEIA